MFVPDCLPIESPFSITHTSIKKYQTSCPRKKYDRLSDCGAPWREVMCVLVRPESEDHQFGSSAGAGCRVMTTRRTATLLVTAVMMMVMMTSRQTSAVCEWLRQWTSKLMLVQFLINAFVRYVIIFISTSVSKMLLSDDWEVAIFNTQHVRQKWQGRNFWKDSLH